MPSPTIPSPVDRFVALIACMTRVVIARSAGERLSGLLVGLLIERLKGIRQRFNEIAASVGNGTYVQRAVTAATPRQPGPGQPTVRRPRQPSPLPPQTRGWLLKLVPEAAANGSQLQFLFSDPAMAALLAAAPASLGRPLRSLCWMLGATPPPVIAAPKRPAKPPKPRKPRPKREPLPPAYPITSPDAPAWMRLGSPKIQHSTRWPWMRQPRRPRTG